MIVLGKYDEIWPGVGYPRMQDSFESKPYTNKEAVLNYLKAGRVHMVTAARIEDIFTGEKTGIVLDHRNDGRYSWSSKLIYYVDKYNLRLPEEFENHVMESKDE